MPRLEGGHEPIRGRPPVDLTSTRLVMTDKTQPEMLSVLLKQLMDENPGISEEELRKLLEKELRSWFYKERRAPLLKSLREKRNEV